MIMEGGKPFLVRLVTTWTRLRLRSVQCVVMDGSPVSISVVQARWDARHRVVV